MDSELFDYLTRIVPDAEETCAGCGKVVEVRNAVLRSEKLYCSEECADRSLALLIKLQPPGFKIDGWDL